MQKFGNSVPANPNRCLTYHGFRRTREARKLGLASPFDWVRGGEEARLGLEGGRLIDLERDSRGRWADDRYIYPPCHRFLTSGFTLSDLKTPRHRRAGNGALPVSTLGPRVGSGRG